MPRQMVEAGAARCDSPGFGLTKKRAFDLILLVPILLLTAPLMLLVAVAVWIFDGAPILFRQTRIGKGGKPFELLKFRTMRQASDAAHREYTSRWIAQGHKNGSGPPQDRLCDQAQPYIQDRLYKMTDDPRITRLGALLRRFSLDELPQLINVLRGEMSLIGPRPAIAYEVAL
jgi:lipopolysaccharide/colanic/teichoic acid biosynthesis glycosyltransferase